MALQLAQEHGGSFLSRVPSGIFTPEHFDSDEHLMISEASSFSRREVLGVQNRLDAQEEGLMVSLIRQAGALGFCGVDAPEAYGGLGLGKALAARLLEMLSLNASFSVTYGITSGISQLGLILFGTEDQRRKYLPLLASGEWIGAYALSEPNSGTDALSLATRADERDGKWILNGTKMWISNAKWADLFLVMAKINGTEMAAFLVERNHPGVSVSREEHKMGLKGSSTARLLLENAEVPLENLVHEPGKGHQVAFNALNIGRFKLGAMSLGPARQAIEEAAKYALDRRQFGRPIAEFGLIQQKLADMAAFYYAAESALYRTGGHIDGAFGAADGSPASLRAAAEEFAVECSLTKVLTTEAEARIIDEALQVFGGYGFTEEFPMARLYRDSRVSRIYEGTNEINRVFAADRLVRRAAEGRASLESAKDSFVSELAGRVMAKWDKGSQVFMGAASDLLLLAYAEQSARLRAQEEGGLAQEAHARFSNWANAEAARAFQVATGEAVSIPAPAAHQVTALSDEILEHHAPLAF